MQMCLPSFVSPSSCTVLLLWCFLLNMIAMCYNINNRWTYFWVLNVQHLCSKNGGGHVFEAGPTFKRLQYVCVCYSFGIHAYLWKSPKVPLYRSNCCCCKCVVSFKLESTECGPNLLYVKLTGVEMTEVNWSTHDNLLLSLLQIIDGRLHTGSTNFDNDGGWEQSLKDSKGHAYKWHL